MKYTVFMRVHGTAVVTVEAGSPEEALENASDEYQGGSIGICHQCSDEISDPCFGEATEAILEGEAS